MAGGDRALFRRRRRMPPLVPLPADAPHVHGAGAGGPAPDHRHHAADPGNPGRLPMGDLPAKPRRADARDGDRPGAGLSLDLLRGRSPGPHQSRHPAPSGAVARERPPQDRAPEFASVFHAGHARHVLRRRDRDGRQHLSRRPRRRPHADAMVARPQRRLLARRSRPALPAGDPGFDLRLRRDQRGIAVPDAGLALQLDAPDDRRPARQPRLRARVAALPLSVEPQGPGLSPRIRGRDDPVRRQRLARPAGGRTRPVRNSPAPRRSRCPATRPSRGSASCPIS